VQPLSTSIIEAFQVMSGTKHAGGRTDTTSTSFVHFMHFVLTAHNKKISKYNCGTCEQFADWNSGKVYINVESLCRIKGLDSLPAWCWEFIIFNTTQQTGFRKTMMTQARHAGRRCCGGEQSRKISWSSSTEITTRSPQFSELSVHFIWM